MYVSFIHILMASIILLLLYILELSHNLYLFMKNIFN